MSINQNNLTPEVIANLPKAMVKDFSFTNPSGGTGLSNWSYNKQFKSVATISIFKTWSDDESGIHFVGVAQDDELKSYLEEVCDKDNKRVYFSEFSLTKPRDAAKLIRALAKLANIATTSDGYVFKRQSDGSWSDGDMSWTSIEALMLETDATIEVIAGNDPISKRQVKKKNAPTL